jgi:hypothetical protein
LSIEKNKRARDKEGVAKIDRENEREREEICKDTDN